MELYLVRHTTPDVPVGMCYGQTDLALADSFDAEWPKVVNKIPHDIHVIYSSPLSRCYQLAQKIARGKPIQSEERLKEIYMGDWEMRPWAEMPEDAREAWLADYVECPTPQGESFGMVHQRVQAFKDEIFQCHQGQRVLVVTHGGVIRILLAAVMGLPLINAFNFDIDYGSVSLTRHEPIHEKVQFINR